MPAISAHVRSISFIAVLLVVTGFFIYVVGGLVWPIFFGMVFAVVLYPLYKKLARALGNREGLSALLTIFLTIIVLFLALYVLGSLLLRDAAVLIDTVGQKVDAVAPQGQQLAEGFKNLLPQAVSDKLDQINLREQVVGFAKGFASRFAGMAQSFTANLVRTIALSLVAFYATFYFLKNGKRWAEKVSHILPLPEGDVQYLADRFFAMTRTSMRMIFVMGAVQGFLGGLIFALLGITAPFFWGLIFALLSLIPGLGHQILWIPTAVILFILGSPVKAIVLIAYGLLVMGFSDDLLRPYLIGRAVKIHPFLILIGTIGGLASFGFAGLIVGPVAASLAAAVWELYERRYGNV